MTFEGLPETLEYHPCSPSVAGLPVACAWSVLIELMCKQKATSVPIGVLTRLGFSN